MTTKQCNKCQEIMPINLFDINKKGEKVYYRNKCKMCRLQETQNRRKIIKEKDKPEIIHKICITCLNKLDVCNFNKKCLSPDGYNTICKACVKTLRRKEKIAINTSNILSDIYCIKCKTYKTNCNFRTNSRSSTGYFKTCNSCWKPTQWNKEKQYASEKKYKVNNPDKFREKYRKRGKLIQVRVQNRLQTRLRMALKSFNYRKNKHMIEYVGCDILYFKKWLEYQFTDFMNWNNIGDWHIDHVMPCSKYNLLDEDEQIKCFNWKNLRPCMAHENLEKSNKIIQPLIDSHKLVVLEFLKINPLPTLSGNSIEDIE